MTILLFVPRSFSRQTPTENFNFIEQPTLVDDEDQDLLWQMYERLTRGRDFQNTIPADELG